MDIMDKIKFLWNRSNDYKQTFGTEYGKKVLQDLMGICNYNSSTFVKNDPQESAYLEGHRRVLLHILAQIKMDQEGLNKMSEQAVKQRQQYEELTNGTNRQFGSNE